MSSGVSPTERWNQTPTGASQSHTSGRGIAGENSPSISQRKSGNLETPISTLSQQQEFSAEAFFFFFLFFFFGSFQTVDYAQSREQAKTIARTFLTDGVISPKQRPVCQLRIIFDWCGHHLIPTYQAFPYLLCIAFHS